MKKYSFLLVFLLTIFVTTTAFANPFTDVPANHWAYRAVNKLVASGIAEGYPDGSFKGKNNLTRYEIAIIVSRILDKIELERNMLAEEIDDAANNLSKAQAEDVTAIVKAILAKNPPQTGGVSNNLSEQQVEEVVNLIEALTFEFKAELKILGQKMDGIYADVDAVEARVAALEKVSPVVSFSGKYSVDLVDQYIEDGVIATDVDKYIDKDGDGRYDSGEEDYKDPYVYLDPWDDDSEKIAADQSDGKVEQTLDLQAKIVKEGFSAAVKMDVHEDSDVEDVLVLDQAELTLENETLKAVYKEKNVVDIADYAYSQAEINGLLVDWKKLGLETFFGTTGYDVPGTIDYKDGFPTYDKYDSITNLYQDPVEDKDDFYVMGARKRFELDNLNLGVNFTSRRARNEFFTGECGTVVKVEDMNHNILGIDTDAQFGEIDLNFDFAHSIPEQEAADNGSLIRLGASTGLPFADLKFNYKNRDENFTPISEDGIVFDIDNDDYDRFTTGLGQADMTGWNFKVTEQITDLLEASLFYANIEEVGDETTKMALAGTMPLPLLIEGLTLSGEYAVEDPVEAGVEETTLEFDVKYTANDYLTAELGYENVADDAYVSGQDVVTVKYGIKVIDYPVLKDLVVRAGLNFEDIGEDKDEETMEYNLGLGYTLGAVKLSYDYRNKEVDGTTAEVGKYNSNQVGLVYTVADGIDFKADYQLLALEDTDGDLNGADDYQVRTATAGVSIAF